MTKNLAVKIAFSVFIVYHLLAIFILPNNTSILCRKLAFLVTPYANAVGLNTSWQFFSPEPSPTIHFVYDADTTESEEVPPKNSFWKERGFVTGQWPPDRPAGMWTDGIRRLVYHSRFTTMSRERAGRFLGAVLCRFYPGTPLISVRMVVSEIPSIERSAIDDQSFSQMAAERDLETFEFSCRKSGDAP